MLEEYYELSFASERVRNSPLAPFVDEIVEHLKSQNCSYRYVQGMMRGIICFGYWLKDSGISIKNVMNKDVQAYFSERISKKLPICYNHVRVISTYWYLSATPKLLEHVGESFEHYVNQTRKSRKK